MLQPSTVYLNGQFMSRDRAVISPDDRGFYFADGVYEVIKFYKGQPFCFSAHMDRLRKSLDSIRISFSDLEKFQEIAASLVIANKLNHAYAGVYFQITRGVAPRTHRFPAGDIRPTVYAHAFPLAPYLEEMRNGVQVMTHEDIRWLRCNVKSVSLLPNTLIFEEAASRGSFECMLIRDGNITEATHSNVFAVKDGIVHTHPDSNFILPGITKMVVLDLCHRNTVQVKELPVRANEISNFDEWFLTGTGSEVVPIIKIDNHKVGNGKPGPVVKKIQKAFFEITYEALTGGKINI